MTILEEKDISLIALSIAFMHRQDTFFFFRLPTTWKMSGMPYLQIKCTNIPDVNIPKFLIIHKLKLAGSVSVQ